MHPPRRNGSIAAIAFALALLVAGGASAQEIFKLVDENGNTTFSDQPPPPKPAVLPRRIGKVDVSEAARRLDQAQRARKQGSEPRPGEFTRVGGVKTVNYRYWKRQEKLRLEVEMAQRRSQATLARGGQVKVSQI